jgi:hypothetical protein
MHSKNHLSKGVPFRQHNHAIDLAFACPLRGSSLKVVEEFELKTTGVEEGGY